MIPGIAILIKTIKNAWNNIKGAPSINQKRYNIESFTKIPENEVQNTCKRSCTCKKKK
jgi:hypothetical protein